MLLFEAGFHRTYARKTAPIRPVGRTSELRGKPSELDEDQQRSKQY